jgi:hypothetical protein
MVNYMTTVKNSVWFGSAHQPGLRRSLSVAEGQRSVQFERERERERELTLLKAKKINFIGEQMPPFSFLKNSHIEVFYEQS